MTLCRVARGPDSTYTENRNGVKLSPSINNYFVRITAVKLLTNSMRVLGEMI
jgi:hypothetical protein